MQRRQKKYKSLGVSVNLKYWNFERNTLKPNCPNYEYLSKLIADKASELSAEIVKLKSERKEFTASTLIDDRTKRVKPKQYMTYSVSKSNGSLMRADAAICCP